MAERSLAAQLADVARELQTSHPAPQLLTHAAAVAVRDIDRCDAAAISIVHPRTRIDTPAATSHAARHSDELQHELGEGPCLEAIWAHRIIQSPDLRTDARWPRWGSRMAVDVGFRSVVAFRLFTLEDDLGALSLYSEVLDGFRDEDADHGMALAAHLAVALVAATHIDQLDEALATRSAIGIAIGIVMERYSLTSDAAFALLTRVSSISNRKIRDLAADLAAGKALPDA